MELRVNTESKVWRYDYVIDEKYEKMDWFADKFETDDELFAQWVLLNRECRGLLYVMAGSTANDSEFDDVLQESYLAYMTMVSKNEIEVLTRDKFKSRYMDEIARHTKKNNIHGTNISSKSLCEGLYKALDHFKTQTVLINDDEVEVSLPFKGKKLEIVRNVCTNNEYDDLIRHFNLGKAESLTLTGATRGAYNIKMDRLIKRVRRRIEAVDKYN